MNENVENKIVFQIMMYLHNENKINFKFYSDMTSFQPFKMKFYTTLSLQIGYK